MRLKIFITKLTTTLDKLRGIKVRETEESYTSVASFLDQDKMPIYGQFKEGEEIKFSGVRPHRGLYYTKSGLTITKAKKQTLWLTIGTKHFI